MELQQTYSDQQLAKVVDEALVYMCACPAQVAGMLSKLRQLFAYQQECAERGSSGVSDEVHERIAQATSEAHRIMEQCMQDILRIEGWDETTLAMPAGLRQLRDQSLLE
jgi:hypothetical protein